MLRSGGELVIMVYARWSLNYLVYRLDPPRCPAGRFPLATGGPAPDPGQLAAHLGLAKRKGLFRYLRLAEFVHRNTDGPANPYALVYDRRRIERDFPSFRITRSYKRFMHAPPLPVHQLPGQTVTGWHMWVHLEPRK